VLICGAIGGPSEVLSAYSTRLRIKDKLVAKLTSRLDLLQRQEEALIEAAALQDQILARRAQASPAAVLDVRVVKAQTEQAA
jgi:hypothetical protein